MSETGGGNFLVLLEAVAKRRGLVFGLVLTATIIAAVVSMVLPKWYEANTILLPPKESSSTIDQLSKLSELVSVTGGLNLPVMVTPSDIYARILQSRKVTDRIVERFNLATRYESKTEQDTYMALLSHCDFRVTAEGLVSIKVEDKDPKIAADMANAFAQEVNQVNQDIVSSRARRNRIFVEDRLTQVKGELDSARKAIEGFQQENKAVDFDEQTRLAIEQASSLKGELAKIDMELQISEQTLGKDNPTLVEQRQKRGILQGQLAKLESGDANGSYFSLPVSLIPTLKGKYESLYSKVKVSETLYNMLLDQLERAKIQEKEESPTITVLDEARVPEVRGRPRRTLIVGATFVLALFFSLILVAFLEYMDRMRRGNSADYERLQYIVNAFFGWLPGVKRSGR